MDSNNEKKSKRPRIGEGRPSAFPATEPGAQTASSAPASSDAQEIQPTGYPRAYQPRPMQSGYQRSYNQGGYQPRQYGQQQGGYQRSTSYQPRTYQPRPAATGEESAATDTQDTTQQGSTFNSQANSSYQPRQHYQQGGYQPRQQGGYQPRQQRPYGQQQGGYQQRQQRPYGQQQGGYQPRQQRSYGQHADGDNQQQNGYQPRQRNNYNNHNGEGGYQPRQQRSYGQQQGGYQQRQQRPYGQQRQGGYQRQQRPFGQNGQQPRQNRFGMPQGGKSFTPRPKRIEYELPAPDPDEQIRLNKYMANAGICSRREADDFIRQGLVKVNGEVVTELGTKITCKVVVEYDEKVITLERKTYILLNKPKDCVTTSDDPNGRTTVLDLVKGACDERIYPVGRLDRNTTGVLLLTNDGDLASKLTHPKYVKKKIYHVWVDKDITEDDMQAIADGIELEDGPIHADAISYATETDRNQAGIEIHSGRNRIVRRIFEKLGYHVTKLDRVYFAGLTKKNLPRGRWRYLTQEEVNFLKMGSF